MPESVAIVTALILERPLCRPCLTTKAGLAPERLEQALNQVARVLTLHRDTGRCRACGVVGPVLSVDRLGK